MLAICALVGGLALFLFGIELLSKGLRQTSGPLLRRVLRKITSNPLRGALAGVGISTLIHNGPTTVMVLGYVNAGILKLTQAIPIIFGANIGTTLSMQVVSFNIGAISFLILAIGMLIRSFVPKRHILKSISLILIGFGLMFVGLETTKEAFLPLRHSEPVMFIVNLMELHSVSSFVGLLLISAVVTAAFQSSGVIVSLLFSMAAVGIISDFTVSIPFLLGAHIGSTMTAVVAASRGGAAMWRLALVQVIFNVAGAIAATLLIPFYSWLIPLTADDTIRQIANFNTLKQVISVILFLPFTGIFEKFAHKLTSMAGFEEEETSHLDHALLDRPERAILAVLHELKRQAGITRKMLVLSLEGMLRRSPRLFKTVSLQASAVDTIQRETQSYIGMIADRKLEPRQVLLIQRLALASHSIERVGQYVEGLGHLLREKIDRNVWFPDDYMRRFILLSRNVNEMLEVTINGIDPTGSVSSECAERAFALGEKIHEEVLELKEQVKTDVTDNGADGAAALLFLRYLYTLERVVSYLSAIATQEKDEVWNVRESRLLDVSALRSRVVRRLPDNKKRDSYESLIQQLDLKK